MTADEKLEALADTLHAIFIHDEDYEVRYGLVIKAMHQAVEAGISAGIRFDSKARSWPVIYIELPTGQVSWHMPEHPVPYDGHSTAEKYLRIASFIKPWAQPTE